MKRSSGLLLPIFCLPSNTGIGNFGKEAYKFIDLLSEAKQKYWQLLPLNPIDISNSPYFSVSQFAGNPLFIDLDFLVENKLLDASDLQDYDTENNKNYIDYDLVKTKLYKAFNKAYKTFIKSLVNQLKLNLFKIQFDKYIKDYVVFESMKTVFEKPFIKWEDEYKFYNINAISKFISKNIDLVNYNYFLQYIFFKQWFKLKRYANLKGVKIIGDVPIYSSNDSSDVWANVKNYSLNEKLEQTEVAGCPPDAFNSNGQLWGNPLYDYDYMKQNKYEYLLKKFSFMFKLYDVIRLDHFRGYESYYAIKATDTNARNGIWKKGPGIELFNILNKKLKTTNIIAEDLGYITDDVKKLLNDTKFPGMRVMQFAFSHLDDQNNLYRPHNYIENSVAYLGTHDNDTFMGWYSSLCFEDKNIVDNYLHLNETILKNIKALKILYNSKSNLVITNIQDILGIGSEGRINTPSTLSNTNWSYRFTKEQLFDKKVSDTLLSLTIESNRA